MFLGVIGKAHGVCLTNPVFASANPSFTPNGRSSFEQSESSYTPTGVLHCEPPGSLFMLDAIEPCCIFPLRAARPPLFLNLFISGLEVPYAKCAEF